jgi:hypothetical protein
MAARSIPMVQAATLELAAKKVEAYSTILVVKDDIAADIRAMRGPTDDR